MDPTQGTPGTRPPPPPPSRRSTVILASKSPAPSPPPKPMSLSSPAPPRKPITLSAAAVATVAANTFASSTLATPPPVPAARPASSAAAAASIAIVSHNNHHGPVPVAVPGQHHSAHSLSTSPSIPSASFSSSVSPSSLAAAAAAAAPAFGSTHGAHSTVQGALHGHGHGHSSSSSSPATSHSSSFSTSVNNRSQSIPLTSSHLRPSGGSASFAPPPPPPQDNPFSDPSNVQSSRPPAPTVTHPPPPPPPPAPSSSPAFPSRSGNQSSLLTARLQATPTSPSLHAPVAQYGSTSPRAGAVDSPPLPVPPPVPRSRSPLAGLSPSQPHHPIPTRHSTFAGQRHSSIQPIPPHSLSLASPIQPVPLPPRRASVQLAPSLTPQQQPRGPSPLLSSPGESVISANTARFRNLTGPHPLHDHLSPQTPKRVFSQSSTATSPYAGPTSPIPDRGALSNAELSDSQSDSDETSDDSDKDYDELEDYHPSMTSNPFMTFSDASPRPTRSRTFMDSSTPPSLPSRPVTKPFVPRHTSSLSDPDVAPALPPKPSIRRRPQPQQDSGSLLSLSQAGPMDPESDSRYLPQAMQGLGPSATDGVFPDYSRSNRRLPLFSDIIGIHDIHQKSHGVRAFSISNEQVATATSNIRIYSLFTGDNISSFGHEKDTKPTALLFTQSRRPDQLGQFLWAGANDGSLQVIDTRTREVVEKKRSMHKGSSITHILRCKGQVWTVDDSGSVFVWAEDGMLGRVTIQTPVQSLTIQAKQICALAVQDMLWSSDGSKINVIRVGPDNGRPKLGNVTMDIPYGIGPLTCLATIAGSGQVFSGHEDGKVIVWSIESREKVRVVNVHAYRIMSLLGVGSYLWAGFATGKIYVLDLRPEVPVVMKDWQAHKDSGVAMLQLDEEGLILGSRHQIGSCAENGEIKVWDGLMAKDRLTKGMVDRSMEYCQWRDLKILICSWNIDASKPTAQDVGGGSDRRLFEAWLTSMDQEGPPDIISVGFQEIVDLESKKMTAKSLLKGSKRAETETISKQYKRWQVYLTTKIRELYAPLGINFKLVECSNLVGLFSCVFVRDQEWANVRQDWTHVDMVKTGLKGYHGNKGGIATRLIIDDSSISFVNCHLAAGQSHTRQRNIDAANVLKKLCHPNPAISSDIVHPEVFWFGDGTMAMDHEICFLSGDLNYRIDVKFSEAVKRIQDQDWDYLHQHDQLLQQKQRNPQFTLRSFNESELLFAPTYKYDPGTDTYDTSSKHRTPAWCDRILWRGNHIRQLFYKRSECRVSDHRPISAGFVVAVKKINEIQRRVVEQQVQEGWFKVQEKEIRIKKLAWLRSWGWTDSNVEGVLDREGGDLSKVVRILTVD